MAPKSSEPGISLLREPKRSIDSFMYYQIQVISEATNMGMHSAKNKPLTKKEREEKRKKKKEKEAAKHA
jgi:hypothetical protein